MIQPLLLLLALVWLLASEPPRYLWYYISVQAAATLSLYGTLIFYSESTFEYARMWGLCSVLLTSAYLTMAYYFLTKHPAKKVAVISAILFSVLCSIVTYRELEKHTFAAWLGIIGAGILAGSGIILCGSATYHLGKNKIVAQVLGCLFLAQSLWNIGFVLHQPSEFLDKANYVLPTMLCLAGWGYLGRRLRTVN